MSRAGTDASDAVVVPAGHGGSSLACLRSLGRQGIRTIGVAESEAAPALRSKYCDEAVACASPSETVSGYAEQLLELATHPRVRTIVPLYEPDIYVLSKRRDEFAPHVDTPWMPFDDVRRVQDRMKLVDAARAAGVPIPETRPLDEWDEWDRRTVIKSRYTILVEDDRATYPGVRFPSPGEEPDRERVVEEMGHVPIVQEFVPGTAEHGFFALFDRGEPVATFQHRRVRSYTYSGGASVFRKSIWDRRLESAGMALLSELDWHGPAMVEFKRDERDGTYRLVEVNPRFWGSLPLAVRAGVDFPYRYVQLASGEAEPDPGSYDVGVGCHVLRGELSYLHSVLRYEYDHAERPGVLSALGEIVASLYRHPNFDYLAVDDVRPFVRDLLNVTRSAGTA